jgi:hypothetical protein
MYIRMYVCIYVYVSFTISLSIAVVFCSRCNKVDLRGFISFIGFCNYKVVVCYFLFILCII